MPTDYAAPDLGGFAGLISLPLVIEEPSDGDEIDAASVDPTFEQLANIAAAYLKYGVKTDATFSTIAGKLTLNGTVQLFGEVDYRPPHSLNGLTVDQTIDPLTAEHFIFGTTTTFDVLGNIVRLNTAGAIDGQRVWLTVMNVGQIGGYCNAAGTVIGTPAAIAVRRGSDDSENICTIDNTNFVTGAKPILQGTTVGFQRISGIWRLLTQGPFVLTGAYA